MSGHGDEVAALAATAAQVVERAGVALPGAEVHVAADRHRVGLTRFAESIIHQNVAEDVATVTLRAHLDGRTLESTATVAGDADLSSLVERVAAMVRDAPLDPGWPGLAPPADAPRAVAPDEATVGATPHDRAEVVRAFVEAAGGLETAGYCRTTSWSGVTANSAGQASDHRVATAELGGIARLHGADGVARHAPHRLGDLDGAALGARAAAKARAWQDPVDLEPQRMAVVLEPCAVADLVMSIGAVGCSGEALNLGTSFVRLGERQLDESLTFVDEPLETGLRHDHDGTPRRDLVVIDAGRSVAVAHDRRSAAEAGGGATSTGHAGDDRFGRGPSLRHLGIRPSGAPGESSGTRSVGAPPAAPAAEPAAEHEGPMADASVAALVAGVERGLLVSELWYTRLLEPRTVALTGLTRNGVWLIEGGEITRAVRNLRFTQSYVEALSPGRVRGVGTSASPVPGDTYAATAPRWSCPALALEAWNFTGGSAG